MLFLLFIRIILWKERKKTWQIMWIQLASDSIFPLEFILEYLFWNVHVHWVAYLGSSLTVWWICLAHLCDISTCPRNTGAWLISVVCWWSAVADHFMVTLLLDYRLSPREVVMSPGQDSIWSLIVILPVLGTEIFTYLIYLCSIPIWTLYERASGFYIYL